MINEVQANAYTEVLSILDYLIEEDYNKIPKVYIEVFEEFSNKNYKFEYDPNKTFEEQNVSKKARFILANLFRDYGATEEQKEIILKREKFKSNKLEEQKRQKYNTDNMFKNKDFIHDNDSLKRENNLKMIEKKEEISIERIIKKIKCIFSKLKSKKRRW